MGDLAFRSIGGPVDVGIVDGVGTNGWGRVITIVALVVWYLCGFEKEQVMKRWIVPVEETRIYENRYLVEGETQRDAIHAAEHGDALQRGKGVQRDLEDVVCTEDEAEHIKEVGTKTNEKLFPEGLDEPPRVVIFCFTPQGIPVRLQVESDIDVDVMALTVNEKGRIKERPKTRMYNRYSGNEAVVDTAETAESMDMNDVNLWEDYAGDKGGES